MRSRDERASIHAEIEAWAAALRARDVDRLVSHYAPEVVAYDIAPPLAHLGAGTLREELRAWFATFSGPLGYELRDLEIAASGDVAFAHALSHLTGERTSGESTNLWMRTTVCLRKLDDRWKVVHEHSSVPLRMDGSDKGAVDLEPEPVGSPGTELEFAL